MDDYFRATVVLLNEPLSVDEEFLRSIYPGFDPIVSVVSTEEGLTVISECSHLHVMSRNTPYLPPGMSIEQLAGRAADPQVRDAILRHKAWMSFYQDEHTPVEFRRNMFVAGLLAAALDDEIILAFWDTYLDSIVLPTPYRLELLDGGEYEEAFSLFSLDSFADDKTEPTPEEVAEARGRIPELVKHFFGQCCCLVKMPFSDPGCAEMEHLWIELLRIDGNTVMGEIRSEPDSIRGLRPNQVVTRDIRELSDWVCNVDGRQVGGFVGSKIEGSASRV